MQGISNSQPALLTAQPRATKARGATPTLPIAHDSIHFGQGKQDKSDTSPPDLSQIPKKGGFKGAGQQVWTDLKRPGWWAKQGAVSTAITLATCWLPGSQLATIPAWFAIALVHSGFKGYQTNPKYLEAEKALRAKKEANLPELSGAEKAKGVAKGTFQGAWYGVKHNFKTDLLFGGAITLATCWLPGTQLVIIPAFMCISAALGAMRGGTAGWKGRDVRAAIYDR